MHREHIAGRGLRQHQQGKTVQFFKQKFGVPLGVSQLSALSSGIGLEAPLTCCNIALYIMNYSTLSLCVLRSTLVTLV